MLAAVAAAAGLIVPQVGIHGVSLGSTQQHVVARLGHPAHVTLVHGGPVTERLFRYPHHRVWFVSRHVVQVETTTAHDRTASHVGVGSTEAQLRAGVAHLRCATEGGVRHCHLGGFLAGRIVTDFFLRRGHVSRVVVGRVID